MTMLAAHTDIEAILEGTVPPEELDRVLGLIAVASAAVEEFTGYRFAPGTYSVSRIVRDGRVQLAANVATVTGVRLVNERTGSVTEVSDYVVRGSTIYNLPCGRVEIDFTVTAPVPDEIVSLTAGIVAATLSGPPVGADQMTAGSYSVSFTASSGRVWLSASDKLVLGRYKRPAAAVVIL
ncbi:hypothetical protein [Rhodococcus triatomae]|nr:hypothetical protein G419_25297 [Rhodococcus triatomae BKS 15-14]